MEEVEGTGENKKEEDEIRRGAGEDNCENPALSSVHHMYEDNFIGSQTEYCADDSFLDDWVDEALTQSKHVDRIVPGDAGTRENERRKEEEYKKKDRDEESDVADRKADSGEASINDSRTTAVAAEVSDTADETVVTTSVRKNRQQKRHKKKCQEQQEGPKEKRRDEGEQRKRHRQQKEGNVEDEEQNQEAQRRLRRENQQRLRLEQRQKKQLEKEAERVSRERQRLEEKKRRVEQREHEREERKRAQKQDQQIRLYFAGADTALLVVALQELLQQPQFQALRDTVAVYDEISGPHQQREITTTKPLPTSRFSSTTQTDTDIDSLPQSMISPVLLDEEFRAVDTLARLCPAGLCIVCMPHPIQNHLQLLQSQMLPTEQPLTPNLLAPPQSEKLLVPQPFVTHQVRHVSIEMSQDSKQQPLFPCDDRSHDTVRSNSIADKSENRCSPDGNTRHKRAAGSGSSYPGESRCSLAVYARFLVLPLFTKTICSRSRETCSHDISACTSSSHIARKNSNPPRLSGCQCPDEPLRGDDACSTRSAVCTDDCAYDGNRSSRSSCDTHFSAAGSCRSHRNLCRAVTTTVNTLNGENHKSALLSLPRQLNKLLEELRGAARVVCIFEGVRASLAVPQPRVEDGVGVEETSEQRCCSSSISHSENEHSGVRCRSSCDSGPASHKSVCSFLSSSSDGCCGVERAVPGLGTPSAAQEDAREKEAEASQGSSGRNVLHLLSEEQRKPKLYDPKTESHENTGAAAGSGRTQRLNIEEGNLLRADKVNYYSGSKVTLSPGELDETIATLIIDCGIDCVEPADATATADYILTAAKHMRAAHRTLGEQHVRIKKSKTFTAAEEAIFAEVAHAATATITGAARVHRPYESAAMAPPCVRGLQATTKEKASARCEATTQAARGTSDIAPVMPTPAVVVASGTAAAAAGVAACPTTGGNAQTVWKDLISSPAGRGEEPSCEDVFTGYEDVFSFACRLWGRQLMQIPTVTERVAAAIMRQYKRPAALLRRLRIAEAVEARAQAGRSAPDASEVAVDANVMSLNNLASAGHKVEAARDAGDGRHGVERLLLVQAGSLALQNVTRKKAPTEERRRKRPHSRLKRKRVVGGVERVVEELADVVLHAKPTNDSQTKSIQTDEDLVDETECASKGARRVAKIGPARARKICALFADNAPAKKP